MVGDCKQLLRTDQSQSALSSCLVIIIKHCQSSWYSPPTLQKKIVSVLLRCKICRVRTARFLAAFQWFISYIFGTKLFIFKGCWYDTQKLQKTRSLVNLSERSALSILIHRALVTQSSPPKVLLDVWAFGIISSDQGAKDLSCFVDQGYMTPI